MNEKEFMGIQSTYFNFFNKTMKGMRKGELTLVSGATGSGKTTFLSQLSIDFLRQGVPTLWGSFEIKNEVLAHTMVQQHAAPLKIDSPEKAKMAIEDYE